MLPTTGQWRMLKVLTYRAKSLVNIRVAGHWLYPPVKVVLTKPPVVAFANKYHSRNISRTEKQSDYELNLNYIRFTKYSQKYKWWDYTRTAGKHCFDYSHKGSSCLFKNAIIKQALECYHQI